MSEPSTVQAKSTAPELARESTGPELLISNLLRFGVVLSLSLVSVGMVVTFFHHPDYFSSAQALRRLTAPEHAPHSLSDVLAGVEAIRGQALVMVGLMVLIATPVVRVALSLLVFGRQRDRLFMAVTFGVLCLLLLSFVLGKGE
ncbi:DUF1634 domain-containing protein [Vitiosangium sp. GDMCC 1.1324]|uniref:DUF1634 domain-containing protein n=1 Tax=Vitiosangium sp. (strain GDMCC 1.1324) TaxID=2138576 RepID=UPI000D35EC96|nr:DUF1634 domain-containing protein [Vitiosangium sp. GDMCC 1.1324]PTL82769.1 DUF1634 domain-containing protein [Vitiosangium sp. GDMCC 1.1324]